VNLKDHCAVLEPDQSVDLVAVTAGLYQELDARFGGFKSHVLISMHDFETDWGMWEYHPAGDEIVVLLSGAARMVLQRGSGEETVELVDQGSFVVIPRGVWHTALISTATRMLFITPGEGTLNRAGI
jgi:mannose-6-phosphate isomerase-like protein (cupin superfamily)